MGSRWMVGISAWLTVALGVIMLAFSNTFAEAFAALWVLFSGDHLMGTRQDALPAKFPWTHDWELQLKNA